jgi:protease I
MMAGSDKPLSGMRVAVLMTDGVEQSELVEPSNALIEAGAQVTVIAPKKGEIQAFKHHDKAEKFKAEKSLDEVSATDFDALLLPGGALNADALRVEKKAQEFAQQIDGAGKPIAVICHGPWLLVSAGLTKGRKLTSYHTIRDDIRNAGAIWDDSEVIRERNWVSSRQPKDIPTFNREMIDLFREHLQQTRRAA